MTPLSFIPVSLAWDLTNASTLSLSSSLVEAVVSNQLALSKCNPRLLIYRSIASKSEGEDCTAIVGAQGVTCEAGRCTVFTCQTGYVMKADAKGRERCHKKRE